MTPEQVISGWLNEKADPNTIDAMGLDGGRAIVEELKRNGFVIAQAPVFPAALIRVFEDHYWDTFQKDRDLILDHVSAVLRQYEISVAIARAELEANSSFPPQACGQDSSGENR